MQYLII